MAEESWHSLDYNSSIQTHTEHCPSCGYHLVYSASKKAVHCNHCGYLEEMYRESDLIVESRLQDGLVELSDFEPEIPEHSGYHCDNCGASVIVEHNRVTLQCGFCGSKSVNQTAIQSNFIQPIGIIPFYLSRKEAETQFKKWIKQGFFHPSKLKSKSQMDQLNGIYIPFWTFDAHTEAKWQGEAGEYYYTQRQVRINGRVQIQQQRQVRWNRKSGYLRHFFDDITVAGSDNLDHALVNRILPYRLDEAINYHDKYVLGWEAEVYNIELDAAYDLADKIIDYKLRHMCAAQLGGDTQRNLHVESHKSDQTYKLLVLPLWISTYRYNNKIYHFMINGQTGRVYGKKPISYFKVAIMILLFSLFIFSIYYLREGQVF